MLKLLRCLSTTNSVLIRHSRAQIGGRGFEPIDPAPKTSAAARIPEENFEPSRDYRKKKRNVKGSYEFAEHTSTPTKGGGGREFFPKKPQRDSKNWHGKTKHESMDPVQGSRTRGMNSDHWTDSRNRSAPRPYQPNSPPPWAKQEFRSSGQHQPSRRQNYGPSDDAFGQHQRSSRPNQRTPYAAYNADSFKSSRYQSDFRSGQRDYSFHSQRPRDSGSNRNRASFETYSYEVPNYDRVVPRGRIHQQEEDIPNYNVSYDRQRSHEVARRPKESHGRGMNQAQPHARDRQERVRNDQAFPSKKRLDRFAANDDISEVRRHNRKHVDTKTPSSSALVDKPAKKQQKKKSKGAYSSYAFDGKVITKSLEEKPPEKADSVSRGEREFFVRVIDCKPLSDERKVLRLENLNLQKPLLDFVDQLQVEELTPVQQECYYKIVRSHNVYICSKTGTGKTLAYLLPLASKCFAESDLSISGETEARKAQSEQNMQETTADEEERGYFAGIPRAHLHPSNLIVVPNMVLVQQVMAVLNQLNTSTRMKSCNLMSHPDMLDKPYASFHVTTPGRLFDLLSHDKMILDKLSCAVVDEADMILEENPQLLASLKNPSNSLPSSPQLVFASSTLPNLELMQNLRGALHQCRFVRVESHKLVTDVIFHFVKVNQHNKTDLLFQFLRTFSDSGRNILIFVNTRKTAHYLAETLTAQHINVSHLYFSNPSVKQTLRQFGRESHIAVCTDYVARGVDFRNVDTVINFDYPFDMTTFIHRAGRTGRVNAVYKRQPLVVSFLSKNVHLNMAREVQRSISENHELNTFRPVAN